MAAANSSNGETAFEPVAKIEHDEPSRTMISAPRIVLQPGLYRSASTWAANVAAELLRLGGPASLLYADAANGIAQEIGGIPQAVVKMHQPDRAVYLLARLGRLPVVITVRDPLDCVASLMQRFQEPFDRSAAAIVRGAELMLAFFDVCEPLVLHYEREPRDAAAVARIARYIGVEAAEADMARIADKLSAKAVGAFIDELVATGYFGPEPTVGQHHRETHWHPNHLGSGASGCHAQVLSAAQIAAVDGATRAFRRRFGYERAGHV